MLERCVEREREGGRRQKLDEKHVALVSKHECINGRRLFSHESTPRQSGETALDCIHALLHERMLHCTLDRARNASAERAQRLIQLAACGHRNWTGVSDSNVHVERISTFPSVERAYVRRTISEQERTETIAQSQGTVTFSLARATSLFTASERGRRARSCVSLLSTAP